MKAATILLLVLLIAGCVSTDARRSDAALVSRYDQPAAERPARFMGGVQDAFFEHVGDSLAGLDFFWRSVSRGTVRDWDRMKALLR